jgi:hypothetical protein
MNVSHRFDAREESDGTWTVFDIFTKLPAEYDGILFTGLTIDEADDAVDLLGYTDISAKKGFTVDPTS